MRIDEFSFFNEQLAKMLCEGLPLEGALKQLAAGMQSGKFRSEIQALEADLTQGTPLTNAITKRNLPSFYRRMVEAGARANDLPGVLTLLADHYHRTSVVWTRLKGLLVYPVIVLVLSLCLTLVITIVFSHSVSTLFTQFKLPEATVVMMWVPPITLGILALVGACLIGLPKMRHRLRWKLPGLREASVSEIGSAIALMLKQGTPLRDSLALAEQMEAESPAGDVLAAWRKNVENGLGKPSQWPSAALAPFPPLFLWLVQQGGEDAAAGFSKASEIYRERANYRIELAMYGALPVSVLFLGFMVLWQITPLIHSMSLMMKTLTDFGG